MDERDITIEHLRGTIRDLTAYIKLLQEKLSVDHGVHKTLNIDDQSRALGIGENDNEQSRDSSKNS